MAEHAPFLAYDLTTPGHILVGIMLPDTTVVFTLADRGQWVFRLSAADRATLLDWWHQGQDDLLLRDDDTPPHILLCVRVPAQGVEFHIYTGQGLGTFLLTEATMARFVAWGETVSPPQDAPPPT